MRPDPAMLGLTVAELRACDDAIRTGSRSFHAASSLLPRDVRTAARALYAFCRASDDEVDEGEADPLDDLRRRLDAIYAGRPADTLADRAFAGVVQAHRIPRALPDAMLEGFAWDRAGRRYPDLDSVLGYAARVASTVGVMMTLVMGRRDARLLARAADLGLAMQLTNIARDVGEDARAGRLYLPADWLREEAIEPDAFRAAPRFTPALGRVTGRLLATADRLYARGLTGAKGLPLGCRPAIRSAGLIYREIGRKVAAAGFDSVSARAVTDRRRKLALIARAAALPALATAVDASPPDPSVAFLVDAAAAPGGEPVGLGESVARFLELQAIAAARRSAPLTDASPTDTDLARA